VTGAPIVAGSEVMRDLEESEFKPTPGYRTRKRGDTIVDCRQDSQIGSRLEVEKCYTVVQLLEFERILAEDKQNFDQRRAVCSNPDICSYQ
jgi:hypothetical protein